MIRRFVMSAFALLVAVLGIACQGDTIVIPTQTVTLGQTLQTAPGGAPSVAVGFNEVAIAIVGHNAECASPPAAGSNFVRAGCRATIAATPRQHGAAVPPSVHGPECLWFLNGQRVDGAASTATVRVTVLAGQFNVQAEGLSPGSFVLEAEVKGVRSGARGFTVQ